MEDGPSIGSFIAQAMIVLFLVAIALITLRTLVLFSMLTWSPLKSLWLRMRGRSSEGSTDE